MTDLGTDPTGGMGVPSGQSGQAQGPSYPVAYQDQNHIVSENGSDVSVTVDRNDSDTRNVDFYQPNGTVVIPSNAASVNVSAAKDDQGKDMIVVKITFPNGATRTLNFHNPKNLNIQAANPDNVTQDASLTGNTALAGIVKVGGSGSAGGTGQPVSSTNANDTPADSVSGTTATYNSSSTVDIHADFNQTAVNTYDITCPGSVTLHGSSYADTFEIKSYDAGPPQKWTVLVHKDGKTDAANTQTFNITGGANTTLNLDAMDQSVVTDDTGGPGLNSVTIGTGSAGGSGTGSVDTSGDTQPDTKTGNTWNYDGYSSNDVNLTAVKGHDSNINVTGNVKIQMTAGETAVVSKDSSGNYIITVNDQSGKTVTTFTVNPGVGSLDIEGPAQQISFNPAAGSTDPESDLLTLQTDPKLKIQGKPVAQTQYSRNFVGDVLKGTGSSTSVNFNSDSDSNINGVHQKDWVVQTTHDIGQALEDGDWSTVQDDFTKASSLDQGNQNDWAESLFHYLTEQLGGGSKGKQLLKQVIAQMSPDVTSKWTQLLSTDTGEVTTDDAWKHGGAEAGWTHQDTINFITGATS
jgi:hypothetical protein